MSMFLAQKTSNFVDSIHEITSIDIEEYFNGLLRLTSTIEHSTSTQEMTTWRFVFWCIFKHITMDKKNIVILLKSQKCLVYNIAINKLNWSTQKIRKQWRHVQQMWTSIPRTSFGLWMVSYSCMQFVVFNTPKFDDDTPVYFHNEC